MEAAAATSCCKQLLFRTVLTVSCEPDHVEEAVVAAAATSCCKQLLFRTVLTIPGEPDPVEEAVVAAAAIQAAVYSFCLGLC